MVSVWTNDLRRVSVNRVDVLSAQTPFGGFKQ
ncbi:hypothetical protein [Mycobacteroides abscessus]|nr:hypothetical protein [Mycobacteroides abscessus]